MTIERDRPDSAAVLMHDLVNIWSAIIGRTLLLENDAANEALFVDTAAIRAAAENGLELTRALYDTVQADRWTKDGPGARP